MSKPDFEPLLSATCKDTAALIYPQYVSIKLDGIRAIVIDSVVYSRSMKPIRSTVVQKLFGHPQYNGLDGELLYGPWNAPDLFRVTTSACMAKDLKEHFDEKQIKFAVFDNVLIDGPYWERYDQVVNTTLEDESVVWVNQVGVANESELLEFEAEALDRGYEGVMIRNPEAKYKQGRATPKENIIFKLKRFTDAEATVTGFEEEMTNTNEAKTNELGRSQRSQAKEGMVGANTLGTLLGKDDNNKSLRVGSGIDDVTAKEIWDNQEKYMGKKFKFKHFEIGAKDAYRLPVFLGFRDEEDMS